MLDRELINLDEMTKILHDFLCNFVGSLKDRVSPKLDISYIYSIQIQFLKLRLKKCKSVEVEKIINF